MRRPLPTDRYLLQLLRHTMSERKQATDRHIDIIAAALRAAVNWGWSTMTRGDIAQEAECSEALVSHYLGTMDEAREAVMRAAVECEVPRVVAAGLSARHPVALDAPDSLKKQAAATLF